MESLNKYSDKNPFKVPDGYFENFEEELFDKIESEPGHKSTKWKIRSLSPYFAIAAGFLLILTLWGLLLKQFDKAPLENKGNNLQYTEVEYLESVNSGEMIEMVAGGDYNAIDVDLNIDDDKELILENTDVSSIIDAI